MSDPERADLDNMERPVLRQNSARRAIRADPREVGDGITSSRVRPAPIRLPARHEPTHSDPPGKSSSWVSLARTYAAFSDGIWDARLSARFMAIG